MTIEPLSRSLKASLARATETYSSQLDQRALDYLDSRGLASSRVIETHRLGVVRSPLPSHEQYEGRLVIPYIGPKGNTYDVRFKCIEDHDHKDVGCAKMLGLPGLRTRMFNTQALAAPTDYIFLAEGEPDAMTYTACGWPAVGIPGANAWEPHHARMLSGFGKVALIAHGDDAGRKLAHAVRRSLPGSNVVVVAEGEDANSLYMKGGKQALLDLLGGMSEDD